MRSERHKEIDKSTDLRPSGGAIFGRKHRVRWEGLLWGSTAGERLPADDATASGSADLFLDDRISVGPVGLRRREHPPRPWVWYLFSGSLRAADFLK